jgi:hypothetical protein
MWVIPSHGRVKRLKELIESMGPLDRQEPFAVVTCDMDPAVYEYEAMTLPEGWKLVMAQGEYSYCGEKMNFALQHFPDAKFYGHICDDVLIGTPDKLPELSHDAGDWHMSFPDDGIYSGRLICFPCSGGELIRAMGFWAHPDLKHNCLDSVLDDVGRTCGLLKPRLDIRYIIKHPFFNTCPNDATYERVHDINLEAGKIFHEKWAGTKFRDEVLARVNAGYQEYCRARNVEP